MKAVRFHTKRDIRVEDIAPPSNRLEPNQVLIKPIVCGICGTDLHEYIAGPIITPGEPAALLSAVEQMAGSASLATQYGASARRFAEENLAADSAVARVSGWLSSFPRSAHTPATHQTLAPAGEHTKEME